MGEAEGAKLHRKTVAYHDEPTIQYKRKNSGEYPQKKSSSHDDYKDRKKSSSADDYKRRQYEEMEKQKDDPLADDDYSAKCYLIAFIISLFVLGGQIGLLSYVLQLKPPPDTKVESQTYSHETSRKALAIASDNLDCSIYMKRLSMQSMFVREMMLHGLMCLAVNEPHSAAADGAVSMMFYYRQNRESLAANIEAKLIVKDQCSIDDKNNSHCDIRAYGHVKTAFVSLAKEGIMNTSFASAWLEDMPKIQDERACIHFRKFYRAPRLSHGTKCDGGAPAEPSNSTKQVSQLTRIYRISRQFADFAEFTARNERNGTIWQKMKKNSSDVAAEWLRFNQVPAGGNLSAIKRKSKLSIDYDTADRLVTQFFHTTKQRQNFDLAMESSMMSVPLDTLNVVGSYRAILIPRGPTCSLFSAFVIRVVNGVMSLRKSKDKDMGKEHFYAALLLAQKMAFSLFPETIEFRGDEGDDGQKEKNQKNKKPSLLLPAYIEKAIMLIYDYNKDGNNKQFDATVQRANPDRVATLINWKRASRETIALINIGLPSLFDSRFIHGGVRGDFGAFRFGNTASQKYTSAAGVILIRHADKNALTDDPLMVVAASGSVRTVEAVSTATLLMLVYDEDPGLAVHSPGAYYDVRDAKLYCDKTGDGAAIFDKMSEEYGISCSPIPPTDIMANDRIAMAMSRKSQVRAYIKAAIDDRVKDFNYATGY